MTGRHGQPRTATSKKPRRDKEKARLKLKQDFGLQGKRGELAEKYRKEKAQLRAELAQARDKDRPKGLRRAFLAVAGKLAKAEFARQERDAARVQEAKERLASLHNECRAELRTFQRTQEIERGDLKDRHTAEDRQLEQAISHRAELDRAREVQDRKPQEQGRERTQEIERERSLHLGPA